MKVCIDKIVIEKTQLAIDEVKKMEELHVLPLEMGAANAVKKVTKASLLKDIEEIRSARYTIAVCGAVKSGKSTFLNALFFGGREVLKTMPTPCTAKLTFITYAEDKPKFEIEFFTQKEYAELSESLTGEAKDELVRLESDAFQKGVSPNQVFGRCKTSSGSDNFAGLKEYVSSGGKYVPFVKQVTIKIKNENLRNLFIVDTPGLDDPNPLNSAVTEEWASKAHAVIYLAQWRGLNVEDSRFLVENFGNLNERRSNRLFVLTRIDDNPDWVDVMDDFKRRFPEEKDSICGFSARAEILRERKRSGERLSEDEECEIEEWEAREFNPDPGRIRELLAERLFSGDVKMRTEKLGAILKGCYTRCLENLNAELYAVERRIDDCRDRKEEAEKKKKSLVECKMEVDRVIDDSLSDVLNSIETIGGDVRARINSIIGDVSRMVEKKMTAETINSDSRILPNLMIVAADVNSEMKAKFESMVNGYIGEAESAMTRMKSKIRDAVVKEKCANEVREPRTAGIRKSGEALLEFVKVGIDLSSLEKQISFWNKTSTNIDIAKKMLRVELSKFESDFPQKLTEFKGGCQRAVDDYVGESKRAVMGRLDSLNEIALMAPNEKKKELDALLSRKKDLDERIKNVNNANIACGL